MADEPPRQPVVLRIKVRYATADAFVERFAPYVARAGLFLRSKQPKPVGTEVRFELRLANDQPVLVGMGVVRWAREVDPDKPYTPPGMAIEFTRVTKESRGVIFKMLELRRALGMADGPRGLPSPPDDDAAVVAASTASATAATVQAETPAPPAPAPARTPEPPPAAPAPAWQAPAAPTSLEPLAARAKRPAAADLVASMSAQPGLASLGDAFGDLDAEEADVPGVLARARAMVGHDIDGELAKILDQDAAPMAITIEEASAGLASLFGTAPVSTRTRRKADDSVPVDSRPAFAAPPPVAPTVAPIVAVADAAKSISADLFAAEPPPAPAPQPQPQEEEEDLPTTTIEAEAIAEAAAAVASLMDRPPPPASDTERTRVVSLEGLAALTAAPPEGATRVVSLDALAAASVRDDEPAGDDERTRIVSVRPPQVDEDARTKIVSLRSIDPDPRADDLDETLDFDRAKPKSTSVPRDFADEPEIETSVRKRPPVAKPEAAPPRREARRTKPPPPPPGRRPTKPTPAPLPAPQRTEGSGSFELDDLVAELAAESAAPVPIAPERSAGMDGLGRSLGGDALDADGLIADLDGMGRRRPPDGPLPDLASFADPPSMPPRRAESLDAALDALDAGDDDAGEERTRAAVPGSHPGLKDTDDDADIEIEIDIDDD